jgi:hypothetical protein
MSRNILSVPVVVIMAITVVLNLVTWSTGAPRRNGWRASSCFPRRPM